MTERKDREPLTRTLRTLRKSKTATSRAKINMKEIETHKYKNKANGHPQFIKDKLCNLTRRVVALLVVLTNDSWLLH